MKFGTETRKNLILCKNCGMIVAKDEELKVNYCSRCGAPLSMHAVEETENRFYEAQKVYADRLVKLASEIQTDSLAEVLKEATED